MIRLNLGFLLLSAAAANAADTEDKSKYHLLKPTPAHLLREMSTDRPDKTESPYTVDAGHFQIESDLVTYGYDHDTSAGQDVRESVWSFATLNLKAGLCNFSDLQVVLFPYSRVKTDDRISGTVGHQNGFGDVLTRLKVNLWGNDGGACAGAIMPFAKWPTSQDQLGNNAIEGGVIIPVGFELPYGFSCGAMTQFNWVQDAGLADYHPEFINTITFGHNIFGKLDGYVEFFSLVSKERGSDWIGTLDMGFTYGLSENMQLDWGVNIGVTKAAPDINPFLGFSIRF